MARNGPTPSNPGLRYLDSVTRTTTDLWNDQIANWTRIWDRVKGDQYTFGNWVHDTYKTWDSWMYGASRFTALQARQFENVLPTLTLMTDIRAGVGPKADLPAPDDFQFGSGRAVNATDFNAAGFENFQVSAIGDDDSKTLLVEVVARPAAGGKTRKFSDVSKGLAGKSASAVIYQGDRPLAVVELAFKH
jgi:hypothetical protein